MRLEGCNFGYIGMIFQAILPSFPSHQSSVDIKGIYYSTTLFPCHFFTVFFNSNFKPGCYSAIHLLQCSMLSYIFCAFSCPYMVKCRNSGINAGIIRVIVSLYIKTTLQLKIESKNSL